MIVIKPKINFKDKRGSIKDIFYKKKINHVAIIKSRAGGRRGDHYHKKTTQWMLIPKVHLNTGIKNLDLNLSQKKYYLKKGI